MERRTDPYSGRDSAGAENNLQNPRENRRVKFSDSYGGSVFWKSQIFISIRFPGYSVCRNRENKVQRELVNSSIKYNAAPAAMDSFL